MRVCQAINNDELSNDRKAQISGELLLHCVFCNGHVSLFSGIFNNCELYLINMCINSVSSTTKPMLGIWNGE